MEEEDFAVSLGILLVQHRLIRRALEQIARDTDQYLVQVRSTRRALEEVERSTSRYVGFEFTKALSDAANFGAPPMFQGALMVHVVNINDLAPGNSFGGILEALFGGIGNFVGGLLGGSVGGFLSALALPQMIASLEQVAEDIREILRMTVRPATQGSAGQETAGSNAQAQAESGESLLTTLDGVKDVVRQLTALFTAAGGGQGAANEAAQQAPEVLTRGGERWMAILNGINVMLDRLMHVVDGLILLIPNVVGAIALFVTSLGAIRREVLETMRFVLRNVLVLRGVLLSTLFDIVATAARLAAGIVASLSTTIQSILASIVQVAQELIGVVFDTLSTLTSALQGVIQGLLRWLVDGVFTALRAIGNEPVFRTIDHMIRVLPSLLGPIHSIIAAYRNNGATLSSTMIAQLEQAHQAGLPSGASATTAPPLRSPQDIAASVVGDFPDFREDLQSFRDTLSANAEAAAATMSASVQEATTIAAEGLNSISGNFSGAAAAEVRLSDERRRRRARRIRANADTLTDAIVAPINAEGPPTGLEAIAEAYQTWLTSGQGLDAIISNVDQHFRNRPASSSANGQRGGVPGLLQGQYDRPRASVEIDEVEIIIEPPAEAEPGTDPAQGPGDFPVPDMSDEAIWIAYRRHAGQLDDRNMDPNDPTAILG